MDRIEEFRTRMERPMVLLLTFNDTCTPTSDLYQFLSSCHGVNLIVNTEQGKSARLVVKAAQHHGRRGLLAAALEVLDSTIYIEH